MRNAHPVPQQPSDMPFAKYRPFLDVISIDLPDRTQPDRRITAALCWLNINLRNGNQPLIEPMGPQAKRAIFDLLVNMGLKEIEIGFPAVSQTDFDFIRSLAGGDAIPRDIAISVLTQSRDKLIDRTLGACISTPRVTVHLYSTLSPLFRSVVFHMDRDQIREPITDGTRQIMAHVEKVPDEGTTFGYEYSLEIFVDTELDCSLEVCQTIVDVWQSEEDREIILNLSATVERATPNVYADQTKWMSHHLPRRRSVCLSLHGHNDRGSGVVVAEFDLMAGADCVEGYLLGHGERTSNVDSVTLALDLLNRDVDPIFSLSDIDEVRCTVEWVTGMGVPPRTPYAGELVYTSFSGSHQDAIKKGFAARNTWVNEKKAEGLTDAEAQIAILRTMPYLPIDPHDMGRFYEAVVRANSQLGKGGVVYLLDTTRELELPHRLQIEFSRITQRHADVYGDEVDGDGLWSIFADEYLPAAAAPEAELSHWGHFELHGAILTSIGDDEDFTLTIILVDGGVEKHLTVSGNSPLDAFVTALESTGLSVKILDYVEHALSEGRNAEAASHVECEIDGQVLWGVGIDPSTITSSFRIIISTINRALR